MAATTQVHVFHGGANGTLPAGAAWVDGARFHRADTDPTTDAATTFIPIPASGEAFSWRKHFLLNITGGTYGSITNLRWFSDGVAMGTGVTMYTSRVTNPAGYTVASSADETTKVNPTVVAETTVAALDATTYTSASPHVVNSGTVASANAVGYGAQGLLVQQVGVTSTAVGGTTTARTYNYRWTET